MHYPTMSGPKSIYLSQVGAHWAGQRRIWISSSLYTFESELELGDFILYEAGDGSVQFCRIPSASIQSILDEIETVEYYLKGGSEQLWISRDVIDKLMGGIDALSKISKKNFIKWQQKKK